MDGAAFFLFGADHKARVPLCQGMADLSRAILSKWTHVALGTECIIGSLHLPGSPFSHCPSLVAPIIARARALVMKPRYHAALKALKSKG